jgi:hypothetical protein
VRRSACSAGTSRIKTGQREHTYQRWAQQVRVGLHRRQQLRRTGPHSVTSVIFDLICRAPTFRQRTIRTAHTRPDDPVIAVGFLRTTAGAGASPTTAPAVVPSQQYPPTPSEITVTATAPEARKNHSQPGRGVDWVVSCEDAFGRRRSIGVVRKPGCVLLVAPPGEVAVLSVTSLVDLVTGLAQEAGHLRHLAHGSPLESPIPPH